MIMINSYAALGLVALLVFLWLQTYATTRSDRWFFIFPAIFFADVLLTMTVLMFGKTV